MTKPVILITGGTSQNGKEAAKLLLATTKYTVRLGARDPSKLSDLVSQGAEAVELGPSADSALKAFTGVNSVYIILPTMVGGAEIPLFKNFVHAAKETGVKHIVYLSAVDATGEFKTVHNHYEHEQEIRKCGIRFTIIRPTYFHENAPNYYGGSIKHSGEFQSSSGAGIWTSVAITDVAAAVVTILTDPDKYAGETFTLEEEALTSDQLAEKISKVSGKSVKHVNMTPEEHETLLKNFMPADVAADLVSLDKNKRESQFSAVRPDLENLLGRKGVSLDEDLAKHVDAF